MSEPFFITDGRNGNEFMDEMEIHANALRISTEKDREPFEAWASTVLHDGIVHPALYRQSEAPRYFYNDTQWAWLAWQACAAHYAPKLTEADALEVAAKHIAIADCGKWETLPEGDERDVHRGRTCRLYYRYLAKSAFSAAGVRWKEEA